jgi:hypothetical protein
MSRAERRLHRRSEGIVPPSRIRLVRAPDAAWLDLRGTEVPRISLPS